MSGSIIDADKLQNQQFLNPTWQRKDVIVSRIKYHSEQIENLLALLRKELDKT